MQQTTHWEQKLEAAVLRALHQAPDLPPHWQRHMQAASDQAAEKAVEKLFMILGMSESDIHHIRADMLYLRHMRQGSEFIRHRVLAGSFSLLVASALWMVWEGVKVWVIKP